ncbi:MAG TPA: phosphate signaling complex protein PhoU [Terriglobales bacterium]|nr:phosphate signaling complex protein PhoU [Terriglobales bacterium]
MTTRTRFHQGLDELKSKLLAMGGLAENAVELAVRAYLERVPELCQKVFSNEARINQAEREIDELAVDLLAMQQPMAVDLRLIFAVIKSNADLERVGDQAVNIAQRVMDLIALPKVELAADIPQMASISAQMIREALETFVAGDADAAQRILEMDDTVDRMNQEVFLSMDKAMRDSPASIRQALDTVIIARNLERVADHATNIAEDVIFWIRGADVRHRFGINLGE